MIDWNSIVAWIALAVSLLAPLATVVINNRFTLKTRREDRVYNTKTKYFEGYVCATLDYMQNSGSTDKLNEYKFAHYKAVIYANEQLASAMNELMHHIALSASSDITKECFNAVIKLIR